MTTPRSANGAAHTSAGQRPASPANAANTITTAHTHIQCDDATRAAQIRAVLNFNRWQTVRIELSFVALAALIILAVIGVIVLATLKG